MTLQAVLGRRFARCWIALAALLCAVMLPAQQPLDMATLGRPGIRVYNDRDGLPQNSIEEILFDQQGYLWVATQNGAARYNGKAWTHIPLPDPRLSQWARSAVLARDGAIWFGRELGGVVRYEQGKWTTYGPDTGLPNARIQTLYERKDGTMLAGTTQGLFRLRGGRWSLIPDPSGNSASVINQMLESKDPQGQQVLWVASEKGLGILKGDDWQWLNLTHGLPVEHITCLHQTQSDQGQWELWVGTQSGLTRWDGRSWMRFIAPQGPPPNVITRIAETRDPTGKRTLWIGTEGGLARFEDGRWRTYAMQSGFPNKVVRSLVAVVTPEGNRLLWIGTFGGVIRLAEAAWTSFDTQTGLPDNVVFCLMETKDRQGMWVGTLGGGLAYYGAQGWKTYTTQGDLSVRHSMALLEDGSGILVGSRGYGLLRMDRGVLSRFGGVTLPDTWVYALFRRKDGTLLCSTRKGLHQWDGKAWSDLWPPSVPKTIVSSMMERVEPDGTLSLWVGSRGYGAFRLHRGQWTVMDRTQGLCDDRIMALLEVRHAFTGNHLWAGTYFGLSRMDLDHPERGWTTMTEAQSPGFKAGIIYQLRTDTLGRVYVFTTQGVYRLSPVVGGTYRVDHYTTGDGLPSNGCTSGSSMVDHRGRIWTGTVAGAALFDPSLEVADRSPKPLVLEGIQAGGSALPLQGGFKVPWRNTATAFKFALLSYYREEDSRFRTQLVGLEKEPTDWTADPKREYPALPSGSYTFKVWARDYAGNVSGPQQLTFTVQPAPWETWWAILGYILLAGGGVSWAIWHRTKVLRERNEELEVKVAERTHQLAETVDALQVARDAADRANEAKSFLMATVGHEIRTPLQGVIGLSEMLLATPLASDQKDVAETLHHSSESLLVILNELLDYSKLEAGHLVLESVPFDPVATLEDAVGLFAESAHRKGLEIACLVDPACPLRLLGDGTRLRQIVMNFLGNAIKFTQTGSVCVEARLMALTEGRAELSIAVLDTGIGIPADKLEQLFKPYAQAEASTYRQFGGTGLGLAICKRLAEGMGGRVEVSSELGKGSRFAVFLPFPLPPDPPSNHQVLVEVSVLAFDPNPVSRQALAWNLKALDVAVRWADSLVDLASQWMALREDGTPCHAVLVAPVEGGTSLDSVLGSMRRLEPGLPILIMPRSREQASDAHGHFQLPKPIRRKKLQDTLLEALGLQEDIATVASTLQQSPRGHILVVDDNETNRKIARFHLQALGYTCTAVVGGEEALNLLQKERFDLVLMDCEMPGLNGFETTRLIRAKETESHRLKILAMTAHSVEHAGTRSLAAGMDGILTKPLRREALLDALQSSEPPQDTEDEPVRAMGDDGLDDHTWAGLEYLEKVSGPGAIAELAEDYRKDAMPRMERLRLALASGDREAVRKLAHDLKSNSATLGAVKLAGVAKRMEYTAGDAPLPELESLLEQAGRLLVRALEAVDRRIKSLNG